MACVRSMQVWAMPPLPSRFSLPVLSDLPSLSLSLSLSLSHALSPRQPPLGTCGPPVIEITSLHSQSGFFTHDPGFTCTSSCESRITYIDGQQGQLLYRGYDVKDLSKNCDYLEVTFLLLHGSLPTRKEYEMFRHNVVHHTMVHVKMADFIRGFRADARRSSLSLSPSHPLSLSLSLSLSLTHSLTHSIGSFHPPQPSLKMYVPDSVYGTTLYIPIF
eukprot:TRINITY_DN4054_c0_g1_i11.p1 TRINITY_DN4054_c0_g1~~TRINITY_DN4054_c0_g1_i11.p1  ORF type:complete len:217 (-),score=41.92 TRINITY_DN4054_c0_g1_i11:244-894(-)